MHMATFVKLATQVPTWVNVDTGLIIEANPDPDGVLIVPLGEGTTYTADEAAPLLRYLAHEGGTW
jgi:hypothetical protein